MLPLPPLSFARTPFTLLVAAVVFALEVVSVLDPSRRDYYYDDLQLGIFWPIWIGQVWRPATTTLLHGNPLHMAFNAYWLVVFGTALEERWGPWRLALVTVLLAYVSTLDQYVFAEYLVSDYRQQGGMVGFSGVVYGLFGLAWAGSRRVADLAVICSRDTVRLMVGWLVFCFVATELGDLPVANAAHLGGLAQGWLIGQAVFATERRRLWLAAAGLWATVSLATLVAAPGHAGYEAAQLYREQTTLRDPSE